MTDLCDRIDSVPGAKIYVLRYGDFGYHLVGPFTDGDAAYAWATDVANNPEDDPRWNTIGLVAPEHPPVTYSPEDATARMRDLMLPELGLRPVDLVF